MLFEFFDEFESTSWVNQGSVWDIISLGHSIPPPIIISDQLPIDLNDRMIKAPWSLFPITQASLTGYLHSIVAR